MSRSIDVSYCCKEKVVSVGKVGYKELYVSKRLDYLKEVLGDICVLSGKYGLLMDKDKVECYDYYLGDRDKVSSLSKRVGRKCIKKGVDKIRFWIEKGSEGKVGLYREVIEECGIECEIVIFERKDV